jgi:hypothetical protein
MNEKEIKTMMKVHQQKLNNVQEPFECFTENSELCSRTVATRTELRPRTLNLNKN